MNSIKKSVLLAGICLLAALGTSRAVVTLSLLDNATGLDSLSINPGDSFSLNVVVAGLIAPGLGHFEILFDTLPTGFSEITFTETLIGWSTGPILDPLPPNLPELPNQWGGVGGSDITGTATLVRANFATSGSLAPANYTIDFIPQISQYQVLQESSGTNIPYNDNSFSLTVVPEPSTAVVAIMLVGVIGSYCYRRRALARASARVSS